MKKKYKHFEWLNIPKLKEGRMRDVKMVLKLLSPLLLIIAVTLALTSYGKTIYAKWMSAPDLTTVPARVPPDQVPEKVNVAGVNVVIQLPQSANKMDANKPVPERVPDEEVPERVNKVERIKVIRIPIITSAGQTLGTLTYRYGFYWYQYNSSTVAVAGFARTQADFCTQRLFARVKLYRDVMHNGNWQFMDRNQSERTGVCVTDSGEARTGYWTAPNGTDWMVRTEHLARWNNHTETWNGQAVDSFP